MKKRLLITSIVMMLVVAVALSTATYAWFTSNATVKASSINVTAATNEAAALAIGWTGGEAGTLIVASDPAAVLKPMAPQHLVIDSTQSDVTFYSATVKSENSIEVFNNDVDSTIVPYTFNNGAGTPATSFYIKNLSKQNTVANIAMTINWGATSYEKTADTTLDAVKTYYKKDANGAFVEMQNDVEGDYVGGTTTVASLGYDVYVVSAKNDGSDLIRVAVFVKESGASTYTLRGILAKDNTTTATIANGTNATNGTLEIVNNGATADCAQVETSTSVLLLKTGTDLAANNSTLTNAASQIDVIVKVWYDGVTLNDNTAGSIANLALQFDKANDPA